MSDKKINLIGKWDGGRLTRIPRQNVRQTLKEKREKFIEELNVLNYDKCPVRELAFFNEHPLLQRIITFLQEHTLRVDTALFLETAILLAHYDISAEPLIGYINHFLLRKDNVPENTYTLSPVDCRMLDEISELLNKYKFPENKKYSSKLEGRLFANEKLTDLVYEEIHINEGIFAKRIQEHITNDALYFIIEPFIDSFCRKPAADYPYEVLYNDLCVKNDINNLITKKGELSYDAILKLKDCPLSMCLAVALDKLTPSCRISNKWIQNNIPSVYLDTFRKLWWQCSVYAKYLSQYDNKLNRNDSFLIKVEKIIGLVELETGEELTMPEDYLATGGIFPKATEVGKETCDKKPKVPEKTPETKTYSDNTTSKPSKIEVASREQSYGMPDDGAREVTRRGRPSCSFRDCFYSNDDVIQDKYLEKFKAIAKGGKGKRVGFMIAAAFEIRILKVTPSFEEAQKELGEIGSKSGYKQYKQSIAREDREYEDIKAQLLKIKEEIDGENAVSTTPTLAR